MPPIILPEPILAVDDADAPALTQHAARLGLQVRNFRATVKASLRIPPFSPNQEGLCR
jgi:hypothetical protein